MAQKMLARLGHDLTPSASMDHLRMCCDCRIDAAADAACCCLLLLLAAAAACWVSVFVSEQQICRFQVPVHNGLGVKVAHSTSELA